MIGIDHALVRRLERSEAEVAAETARSIRRLDPAGSSTASLFRDGALVANGPGRYVNRALGITVDELSGSDLAEVRAFYAERNMPSMIQLSPWAPPATLDAIRTLPHRIEWFRSVFVRPASLPAAAAIPDAEIVEIVEVDDDLMTSWLDTLAAANGIDGPDDRSVSDEMACASRARAGTVDLVALVDGQVAGCASMQIDGDIAWLGGAGTRPASRGRGVQSALLRHRISMAAELGLELCAATALPAGTSAHNLIRAGFTHAETQTVISDRS